MIRVRERGTAGTHNGMKSVIGSIGAIEFCRVRIGVQPDHPIGDLAAYVLHPMKRSELEQAAEMVDQAAKAVEIALAGGVHRAMNRFNKRVPSPDEDEEAEQN
jgi:PTH1 family peptidyl-tRNA hydrolase